MVVVMAVAVAVVPHSLHPSLKKKVVALPSPLQPAGGPGSTGNTGSMVTNEGEVVQEEKKKKKKKTLTSSPLRVQ